MKKGPLSKTEKEFVDSNKKTMTLDQLAEKLERSIATLEKYLQNKPSTAIVSQEDKTQQPSDINLYARNKNRGVVVMTESASMASDEKRSKPDVYASRKYRDVIHKIREE